MATPHDDLFRHTFGQPPHAAGLLRTALPTVIADAIDWGTLQPAESVRVDRELQRHVTDLLFTVELSDRKAFVYVLLEHKSYTDRFVALQLLRYIAAIWDRHHQDHPEERLLPPVIPVVVHHGERRWTISVGLRELIDLRDLDPSVAEILIRLQPDFRFLLDDLASQSEAELMTRALTALGQLNALCLQYLRDRVADDAEAAIARWAGLIRRVLDAPDGRQVLLTLCLYILRVTELPAERLRTVLARVVGPEAEESMKYTADKIAAEAEARGQATILLRQLTARFGQLATSVADRVRGATITDLERWAERVLFAETLDQVFGDDVLPAK